MNRLRPWWEALIWIVEYESRQVMHLGRWCLHDPYGRWIAMLVLLLAILALLRVECPACRLVQ